MGNNFFFHIVWCSLFFSEGEAVLFLKVKGLNKTLFHVFS
ncbi:hypothetical protein M099_1551 [Phocaeicola vulgatus str. 3975 RP4]|uniref:Uncharacterized protein n=2 Tax=Phocaeicola vulgatus TaxID=821 RepID=A0A069ST14_PHOVU|nr:hypothetical protein CUU_3837 [Phocaeicola vulgatus PC510]KDS26581.1 hypothetical protein M098_2354 [Phocaeicola vulgatus str. 3775 SR(B) 19]KDS54868.1 hypothetical protein M099_1551 [Phocaeicola vulgatus str. 3975 RP4]